MEEAVRQKVLCRFFLLSEEQSDAGLNIEGKTGAIIIITGRIKQDGRAIGKRLQRPGSIELLELVVVTGDTVNAKSAEQSPGDGAMTQLVAELFTFADGQIDGPRCVLDEMELSRHLCKRIAAAVDAVDEGIQNMVLIQRSLPALPGKFVEISGNRIRVVQLFEMAGRPVQSICILSQHLGRIILFQPEAVDKALFRGAFAFTVAAPGGLQQRVQPGGFPISKGKIHVHTGLNQGGGHHPAGQAGCQPLADLLQLPAAVSGTQQGGQAVTAFVGERGKEFLRCLAAVDYAEDLRLRSQLLAQDVC